MSTTSLPPAGWYQHGDHGTLTWWDGHVWGQTASEYEAARQATAEPAQRAPRQIYWSNLFRFRTLWFLFIGPIVGGALIHMLIPIPPLILWLVLFVGIAWSSMTSQMACHQCGTILRVTRLSGQQDVCHKCGTPTDRGIAKAHL